MTNGWTGSFEDLMRGTALGDDRFKHPTAAYPWGRVYGGQVVAQALWAAGQTVDAAYEPHSLHAYFIRGGRSDRPIYFEVERTRDGRSFMTRHVLGKQDDEAGNPQVMLELTASFHTPERTELGEVTAKVVAGPPDSSEICSWTPLFERFVATRDEVGAAKTWARFVDPIEATPLMWACALAFISDDVPTEAVLALHPTLRHIGFGSDTPEDMADKFMSASLDHAIWFHRIPDPTLWQLHAFRSDIVENGRGLSHGQVFNESGELQATVAQEIVIRVAH